MQKLLLTPPRADVIIMVRKCFDVSGVILIVHH